MGKSMLRRKKFGMKLVLLCWREHLMATIPTLLLMGKQVVASLFLCLGKGRIKVWYPMLARRSSKRSMNRIKYPFR